MTSRGCDALVAAALAAFVTLVVPLQSFIGNASLYPYSPVRILSELCALSVVGFTVVFALLRVTGRFLGAYPRVFLVGLLVCGYLETGVLSAGLPPINGGFMAELSSVARRWVDFVVWTTLIVGFLAGARWLRGFSHWIAAAVLLLGFSSLFDVRHDRDAELPEEGTVAEGVFGGTRVNQMTVVANVKYSPKRNILVFILDSFPGTVALETVQRNPTLRSKFPGFTAYARNIGMHECTKRGVPGLVTGRYYDPAEMSQAEYPLTMYGSNSFLTAYCKAGSAIAFSPDLLGYGYTNLPILKRRTIEDRRSRDALAILRRTREVPYLCLFDMVAFRLCPFMLKGPVLYAKIRHAVRGRHSNASFWGEPTMYADLAAAPINDDARQFLGVFHSWGVHPPWEGDLGTAAEDKLVLLGDLMEAYRKRGLYDTALIVVTSDHGLDFASSVDGFPPSANALLWVKPEGSSGAFEAIDLKTSHARISQLLKKSCGKTLLPKEINDILHSDRRLFRREIGHNRFEDIGGVK